MGQREARIQKKIRERVEELVTASGGDVEVIKMHGNMYSAGWPDLMIIIVLPAKAPITSFIEVKQPGGKPTARQQACLDRLTKLGLVAKVLTSPAQVHLFLEEVCRW